MRVLLTIGAFVLTHKGKQVWYDDAVPAEVKEANRLREEIKAKLLAQNEQDHTDDLEDQWAMPAMEPRR